MTSGSKGNQQFVPNHIGTQPRKYGNNKGAKYQNKGGNEPQVIQTKGE
ncbi:Small acid-soluble spore protein N family [Schinkia azotoformans MEV2011]|uniref:Small, acid-soluble spore protein N n=2 Tax=Schinkia azotoformans TaxID=1454 RepID=K6CU72_SCHAZ|nr:acid-soluble spore protein N [Schinkia azotoformans]EKN63792.1 acid-soluble spore protein N [Schinkia azotoformans LMG 9581]KEF38921.1 Small acid-soluble spore protein N family [Schinkia azotoformans MEV2011]MEC1638037.1 acid-soluble spore protein N [Schinkia azotoformans]MEC1694514.1 acid-soluble spore protein N [Schinkia azotoformans]MEC1714553.1 acid-soluble spore protein N [Schinkia azotoformans]